MDPRRSKIQREKAEPRNNPSPSPEMKVQTKEMKEGEPQWLGHPNPHQLVATPNLKISKRDPREKGVDITA